MGSRQVDGAMSCMTHPTGVGAGARLPVQRGPCAWEEQFVSDRSIVAAYFVVPNCDCLLDYFYFAAMAATSVCAISAISAPPSVLERTSFTGVAVQGLPVLRSSTSTRPSSLLRVEAKTRKVIPKEPLGPSGDLKLRGGVDAGGRVPKGKGVYQFKNKYGANVDGYSPIYDKEEWSKSGDVYVGGVPGLAIWAALLGGILLGGALLVYNTSALAP